MANGKATLRYDFDDGDAAIFTVNGDGKLRPVLVEGNKCSLEHWRFAARYFVYGMNAVLPSSSSSVRMPDGQTFCPWGRDNVSKEEAPPPQDGFVI